MDRGTGGPAADAVADAHEPVSEGPQDLVLGIAGCSPLVIESRVKPGLPAIGAVDLRPPPERGRLHTRDDQRPAAR